MLSQLILLIPIIYKTGRGQMHCICLDILSGKFRKWVGGEAPLSRSVFARSLRVFQKGCQRIWNENLVLWISYVASTTMSLAPFLFQIITPRHQQHKILILRAVRSFCWQFNDDIMGGLTHVTATSTMQQQLHKKMAGDHEGFEW